MSPRRPSSTPSLGTYLGDPPLHRTPNQSGHGISRSNSARSMPFTSTSEMPLDELMNTGIRPFSRSLALIPATVSSTTLVVSGGADNALLRMSEALQLQIRPVNMKADEEQLWEVVQQLLQKADDGPNANSKSDNDATYWEQKYKQREIEWSAEQNEHDRALRAIQRVLADREESVNKLKEELECSQQQRDDTILKLTHKLKEMQEEVTTAKDSENEQVEGGSSNDSKETVEGLKTEKQAQRIQQLEKEVMSLRSNCRKSSNLNEDSKQEDLLKQLEEKTTSLENAKMIIASLENANGSLTRELRAKLKEKEEELANLTNTSADRKRTLDSLATELRELQRQQQRPRLSPKQVANQRSLCHLLEKNVKSLRQAAVQHEAKNDRASVDRISLIVSETFSSLKQNLESWESYLKNETVEATTEQGSTNSSLEASFAKKNDELKGTRKELEQIKSDSVQEIAKLKEEVGSLKQQLAANMEVLAKKGRELAVLKDSLNLDDDGVGYISDDGTDGDEMESEPVTSCRSFPYSSPETNAFTGSLLVHGGPGVNSVNPNAAEMSDATAAEIQMLKNEVIKQQKERESKMAELQAEKESLANAKMIISSLEKANKSMLEDLRSRLQDSNTAIASLLEKSIEHEKTIAALRKELEVCRRGHEEEEQKATTQMAKLRDENLVFSMRLAAKDREVEELQTSLAFFDEGQEVSISKVRMSSVEEKKDDPVSDEER